MKSTRTINKAVVHVLVLLLSCAECVRAIGGEVVALQRPSPVEESDGTVEVCVELTGVTGISGVGLSSVIEVNLAATDSSATMPGDYTCDTLKIVFPVGTTSDTTMCTNITIVEDDVLECDQYFTVEINSTSPNITVGTPSIVTVTIKDTDDASSVKVAFEQTTYTVSEGDGTTEVCVVVSGVPGGGLECDIVVTLTTINSDKADDFDVANTLTATFSSRTTFSGSTACANITILDDATLEGDHSFTVLLASTTPTGVTIGTDSSTTVTIPDNDAFEEAVPIPLVNDVEDQTTKWTLDVPVDFEFPVDTPINNSVVHFLTLGERGKRQSSPGPASEGPLSCYLLFANRHFLVGITFNGTIQFVYNLGNGSNAIAIDYDYRDQYIFWTDVAHKIIARVNLDGTGLTVLVDSDIQVPDGMAWDWVNKKLYWTDAEDEDIEVMDPANGYRTVLISTGTGSTPRAIVVDPATRYIYWTDWGIEAKIERASMDGSGRTILHNTELVWPNGLTIDYNSQTLYWVDAYLDNIESSNVDGSNRQLLFTTHIYHPFGIVVYQDNLYWTDWQLKAVLFAPVSQPQSVGVVISGLNFDPQDIHAACADRQPLAPPVVTPLVVTSSLSPDLGNQVIVTVTWEPPSNRNGPFDYNITYSAEQLSPYPEGRRNSVADSLILTGDQNQYIINNGLPFANYTVTIYAFNTKSTLPGPSSTAEHRSLALKPTAVTNLAAVATDFDSILVTWDLPLFPNGPIAHYILYYIESDEVQEPPITSSGYINKQVDTPTTEFEITGLKPLTNYAFHVQPYGGPSLPGDVDDEILQRTDGFPTTTALFQLKLTGDIECSEWVKVEVDEKRDSLIAIVLSEIDNLCNCGLSACEIDADNSGFQCSSDPNSILFRAELSGALCTTASDLILCIEQWISDPEGVFLPVLGLFFEVDPQCEVEIQSTNDPECEATATDEETASDSSTGANVVGVVTVAGVVTGVVFIIVLGTVAVVIALIITRRRRHTTFELTTRGLAGRGAVISMNRAAAVEMMGCTAYGFHSEKQQQNCEYDTVQGDSHGDDDHIYEPIPT